MKDSSYLQPLIGSGKAAPHKQSNPHDVKSADGSNHQKAAEFTKHYRSETEASKSSEEAYSQESVDKKQGITTIDLELTAIESDIYKFSERETSFEGAIVSHSEIPELIESETDIIQGKEIALNSEVVATIKTLENRNTFLENSEPENLLAKDVNQPAEAPLLANAEIPHPLQTIKTTQAETGIIKQDVSQTNLSLRPEINDFDVHETEISLADIDEITDTDISDMDMLLDKRSETFAQQTLFPNAAQSGSTQPIIGLGLELAAPTVLSGTSSITPTTPSANPITPAVSNAIVTTVAEAILTAKETPKGLVVQLDPPEMGRVYIDFMFDGDNRVNVIVKADNPESFNILRERSQEFLQMLNENGFSDVDLSFQRDESQSDSGEERAEYGTAYGLSLIDSVEENFEASYDTPLYRLNSDQLRLDLRL